MTMESSQPFEASLKKSRSAARARGGIEEEVRAFLESYAQASGRLDVDGVMQHLADDIVTFDCPPPLQYQGKAELRDNWQKNVIDMFEAPVQYTYENVHVLFANDTHAAVRAFMRFRGTPKDRAKHGDDMRATLRCTYVLEKRDGRWLIVHDHNSAPIDYDGKGAMELEPTGDER